ncbi:transcriptional repressor [Geranomyces variabilis]|nr:transcriptional repressor [Geranomyces variabilis]
MDGYGSTRKGPREGGHYYCHTTGLRPIGHQPPPVELERTLYHSSRWAAPLPYGHPHFLGYQSSAPPSFPPPLLPATTSWPPAPVDDAPVVFSTSCANSLSGAVSDPLSHALQLLELLHLPASYNENIGAFDAAIGLGIAENAELSQSPNVSAVSTDFQSESSFGGPDLPNTPVEAEPLVPQFHQYAAAFNSPSINSEYCTSADFRDGSFSVPGPDIPKEPVEAVSIIPQVDHYDALHSPPAKTERRSFIALKSFPRPMTTIPMDNPQAFSKANEADEADESRNQPSSHPIPPPRAPPPPPPPPPAAVRRYACTVRGCEARFTTSGHRARHIRSHLKLKSFECEICHKWFSRRDNLGQHVKTHFKQKSEKIRKKENSSDSSSSASPPPSPKRGGNKGGR